MTFARQDYARQCPLCRYLESPQHEADERPSAEFCPYDGFLLTIMACAACGAPIIFEQYRYCDDPRPLPHCKYCGAERPTLTPKEPQLIPSRPLKKAEKKKPTKYLRFDMATGQVTEVEE